MPEIAVPPTPAVGATIVIVGRRWYPDMVRWPRTVSDILELTGAGKSQTYDTVERFWDLVPSLSGKPGRPCSQPLDQSVLVAILLEVNEYLCAHPGAVSGVGERRTYTDDFRRFVVGLAAPGQPGEGMSCAELAMASGVPLGTLKDWLHPQQGRAHGPSPQPPPTPSPSNGPPEPAAKQSEAEQPSSPAPTSDPPESVDDPEAATARSAHLRLIIKLWRSWSGTFEGFCRMLRGEHRLPYCDTFVGDFLHGIDLRRRRPRTPVEAPWSSDTFRSLFPNAQWLGDGTSVAIQWGDQTFVFNLEALLDVASNSMVGLVVSDAEDEEALLRAFEEGLVTAGSSPIAVTLDNRLSNHTAGVVAEVAPTIVLRSTPGRGQAKAAIEGAFGLFEQAMPPLILSGETPREMARCALHLIWTAWARGRNGKPRKRLNGRTPAEAYANARPTPEEIQEAHAWFQRLQQRQERARLTREARLDPIRKELLTRGLAELGIPDPDGRLAIALAGYGEDAIVRGIAIFRSKQERKTLPPDADPERYLGGIIRNLHIQLELELISIHLLEQRLRLRDLTLAPLERAAESLRKTEPLCALPQAFIDHALAATSIVDFRFWGKAAAEALAALPAGQANLLYQSLARRIAASFKTDRERREDLIDWLAQAVASTA